MSLPFCVHHIDLNFVQIRSDYLRRWFRRLASMGYNAILWEVEDKVRWDTCRHAVWPEAISKAEFRGLIDESRSMGLEPIPLLQTIGHAEYVLKQDAYKHMRELPEYHDSYCTENPEVRTFLKELITEYLEVFGNVGRFHLGGDEAYRFGQCPTCRQLADRIGHNSLYSRHILNIAEPLMRRDVKVGIWSDMILAHPDEMDAIPTELEIWDWNYWDLDEPTTTVHLWGRGQVSPSALSGEEFRRFPEIAAEGGKVRNFYTADVLKRMGYSVFLCSAVRSAGDTFFCPQTHRHARNIAGAARRAADIGLLGTCVTDWALRLNSWETHLSLLPIAPAILESPAIDVETAVKKATEEQFDCDSTQFVEAVDAISGVDLPFCQAQSTGIQWNGLKDSLLPPTDFIQELLQKWKSSGRLDRERESIDATVTRIRNGIAALNHVIERAGTGFDVLQFWSKAAWLQFHQAQMAREILYERRSAETARALAMLRADFEHHLSFDQTSGSAGKNAGLVYDCLVEYMES